MASKSSSSSSSSSPSPSPSRNSSSRSDGSPSSNSSSRFFLRRLVVVALSPARIRYTLVASGLAVITTHPSHSPAASDPATTSTHLLIPGARRPSVNRTSAVGNPWHSTWTPTLPCRFLFLIVILNLRVWPGSKVPTSIAAFLKCVQRGRSAGRESRRVARSIISLGTGAPELTRSIAAAWGLALDTASTCAYLSYLGYASRSRGLCICRRAYTASRRLSSTTSLESHSSFFSIASTALVSSRLAPRPPSSPLLALPDDDDPSFPPVFLSCAPAGRCHASVAIWHTNDTNSSKSS
mmetsp:Transcript_4575/g.20803  ORF Transcript_4575/g.20803 Transcript_4575/m.20803 type:complete len:295 (+) Transcript_4575:1035-1919(+)